MRGYDLIGQKLASYVGKNKIITSFGTFFAEFVAASYYNEINNKPLTVKQKIYKHVFCKTIERPMLKFVGWTAEKLEKRKNNYIMEGHNNDRREIL